MNAKGAHVISKVLSANDVGETGTHQAGILIPKREEILSFFPQLDRRQFNPRVILDFEDPSGKIWEFSFIYYNNKLFGKTRNEYRLTGMTEFVRRHNLHAGDKLLLSRDAIGKLYVDIERHQQTGTKLILKKSWKVISI